MTNLPEKTYLTVARGVDPVDPEATAANRSFRATVDAAFATGREDAAADIRAFADVRENSARQHPPSSDEAFRRNDAVVAAYRKAALIALHGAQP
ncbi:hypothetical protein ABZ949_01790 [Micromonospora tulbaghiae]|uniref:hypothetical protein n=1 Tax=Micromonospora tulbaghiae TaxID=479978 RepID=UPI003407AEC0